MRVLLINKFHYLRGGAERCYFDTARILASHGHDIAFFSMTHRENKPSRWSKYFVREVDYEKRGMSLGEKINSTFRMIYNFSAQKNLEKLIKEFKPDIAHLHNIYHQLSPSIIKTLKKYNIPAVITLHDYKLICPNYNLLVRGEIWERSKPGRYYKCFLDRCIKNSYLKSLVCTVEAYLHKWLKIYDKVDAFISPSQFLIGKFKEFGFKKKINYLPNPLPPVTTGSGKGDKITAERYILYFGRLSQEKGVDDLIKAYSFLKTNYKLVIVGEGPRKDDLEKIVKDKNLSLGVVFVERKEGANLWRLVEEAEFIVVPSRWYENAPYSVIEAMNLTKIVVCANIGGLSEIIKDGKTGFLFKAGDVSQLTKVMDSLLDLSEEEKRKIGEQAAVTVREKNNKEVYYKNLIRIYGKVISEKENKN